MMKHPWEFIGLFQGQIRLGGFSGSAFRGSTKPLPRKSTGLRSAFFHPFAGITRAQRRRAAIRELMRLSDHHLADLGIERSRIAEVVDGLANN